MKQVSLGALLLAVSVYIPVALAAGPVAEDTKATSAVGHGSIKFGKKAEGVGFLHFNVSRQDGGVRGTLLFAAEDHHEYPHEIVRVAKINSAQFTQRDVAIVAKGLLHDEEVTVRVRAHDGNGTSEADYFSIHCFNKENREVLHAEGELTSGNVVVGTAS